MSVPGRNKGERGQALELILGIPNSSALTDLEDGELKTFTVGAKMEPNDIVSVWRQPFQLGKTLTIVSHIFGLSQNLVKNYKTIHNLCCFL